MRSCQNCFESSLRHGCVVVGIASLADFPCRIISAATLSMIGPADRRAMPVLARGGRSDRASELFFSRFEMPRPKPSGHLFDLVRTKIIPRFELVAQSAPDDGPVEGAILIRGKSPASWLMRDAVVANFKLLDQDQSSNSHRACHAHRFAMRTLVALHLVRRSESICSS